MYYMGFFYVHSRKKIKLHHDSNRGQSGRSTHNSPLYPTLFDCNTPSPNSGVSGLIFVYKKRYDKKCLDTRVKNKVFLGII